MSELKTEKYRYWLTYLLEDLPVGAAFEPGDLHVTLIPWFVVPPDVEATLAKTFELAFSGHKAFDLKVNGEVSLGPRQDISVFLLDSRPEIYELHKKALGWFESLEAKWAVKNPYVGDEFKPHIRRRPNTYLHKGDKIHFNSLTLVQALRRSDNVRTVKAKVVFDE